MLSAGETQGEHPMVTTRLGVIRVMVLEITRGLRSAESSGQQRQPLPVRVRVSLEVTWREKIL